jgi:magnesium-protoporphyrin O-methyltransferase
MPTASYLARRAHLETYFDRTALDAWAKLTCDVPVSGIRATVRAGRDRMRATLMSWLPANLHGARLLDAGCGTGALSVEAARRGAHVIAVDLSPALIQLAKERHPAGLSGRIEFHAGDMLGEWGSFDYCVAMDSLIHYRAGDLIGVLSGLAGRTKSKVLFTFAPKTLALTIMHNAGKLFPRSNRSPAIEPVAEATLARLVAENEPLRVWHLARSLRVVNGFYTSQAMELIGP